MNSTAPANEPDIHQYRAWMEETSPIAETERKFLDHPTDLITFCNSRTCAHCDRNVASTKWVDLAFSLVPLLAYFFFSVMGWFCILFLVPLVVAGFILRKDIAPLLLGCKDTILNHILGPTIPDDASKEMR